MHTTIYLAGGCFWGVEAYFQAISGVTDTEVGYAGGQTENPSYEQVCTGATGHAEVAEITFDTEIITLDEILRHFERIHEPTSLNRQGNDIGSQYRSAIFTTSPEDLETAQDWKTEAESRYPEDIMTEISRLDTFYPAEDYHQDYLQKHPGGYCHIDLSLADTPLE